MNALILDSEAISRLAERPTRIGTVHAALAAARATRSTVAVPAAVLAEQYRGGGYNKRLDAFMARNTQIEIVDTDRSLARMIGAVLSSHRLGSQHHVDASVISTAIKLGPSVILTCDVDDLRRLAIGIPAVEVENVD